MTFCYEQTILHILLQMSVVFSPTVFLATEDSNLFQDFQEFYGVLDWKN
jgi:hypothetical protein